MTTDFLFNVTTGDIIYDIETFPNCFTLTAKHVVSGVVWTFEISDRRDEMALMKSWMTVLKTQGCRLVGFNNLGFDYPVIHYIYHSPVLTVSEIYDKAMSIINTPFNARFSHIIWEREWAVPQLDLFKMMHFDNMAKSTSLKVLEFNMRMDSVEDLPFDVGKTLTNSEMDVLLQYNMHDVDATLMFYCKTQQAVKLREDLSDRFDENMMNMSDVKIGETLLINELDGSGVETHTLDARGRKQKKQTIIDSLDLSKIIFPYVSLERPEFQRIHQWLMSQTITETKGVFEDLTAVVNGLEYKVGTGGLHASMHGRIVCSSDTHQLIDVDVASFYPNLAIKNKLYPRHLGVEFCSAYLKMYHTRQAFPKKTAVNESYKLALNGAFGGANNKYSPFFDMSYAMSITINGQLLLLMLVEQMLKIPNLTMIQCNTDGITYLCPREHVEHTRAVCKWWEKLTKLDLEEALYNRMFVRDVNNYIAEYEDGGLKRIGAYAHVTAEENSGTRELPWHKDWSARVVAKAAEAYLVHGVPIRDFITNHDDKYDFLLRTKVPRNSYLLWGQDRVPNIIRYYISTDGDFLEKVSPPTGTIGSYKKAAGVSQHLYDTIMAEIGEFVWDSRIHTKNQSTHQERKTGIHTGWTVEICNDSPRYDNINYEYYIKEVEKLTLHLVKR